MDIKIDICRVNTAFSKQDNIKDHSLFITHLAKRSCTSMFLICYKSWGNTISCMSDLLTVSLSYNHLVTALDWYKLATLINNQWLHVHTIRIWSPQLVCWCWDQTGSRHQKTEEPSWDHLQPVNIQPCAEVWTANWNEPNLTCSDTYTYNSVRY